MKISELGAYLDRADVSVGTKIDELIKAGLPKTFFIAFAENLIETVGLEDAYRNREKIELLAKLVAARKRQLE